MWLPRAVAILAAGIVLSACGGDNNRPSPTPSPAVPATSLPTDATGLFSLSSGAFDSNAEIPAAFTCEGADVSPELTWNDSIGLAESFAVIMNDPDAQGGEFTHWLIYDLPESTWNLAEGVGDAEYFAVGGLQGRNDFGRVGYDGPCPPDGPEHRYDFQLFALDEVLGIEPGAVRDQLLTAMTGHILATTTLTGTYQR